MMERAAVTAIDVEEQLVDLLDDVASRFSCAKVKIISERGPRQVELSCSLPKTAKISVIPDPGQIDVFIGLDTRLEFLGNNLPIGDIIEKLRPIVEAVVGGRFVETVWEKRGRVLRSASGIRLKNDQVKSLASGGNLLGFFWRGGRRIITYKPYH